jgi:uncharacterized protein (DUF305 family)
MKKLVLAAVAALTLASVAAYAQMQDRKGSMSHRMHGQMTEMMPGHMMGGHANISGRHGNHESGPTGDSSPSSLAFHGINAQMHRAMNIAFTGNADVDFVKGMIPHHKGAVDMAKTVLAFGKDPAVRKLAEEIIKAQESEITLMQDWLKKNGQ